MKVKVAPEFFKSLKKCFRPWYHPSELWYSFKCWAWRRHSTVRPRNLPHTWCDRCVLLPHMMFEILGQFLEKECNPEIVEWYNSGPKITVDGNEVLVRDEMQTLWDWWRVDYLKSYPKKMDTLYDALNTLQEAELVSDFKEDDDDGFATWDPQYKTKEGADRAKAILRECNALEHGMEEKLNCMMHRIVNIREFLWT